jgi:hypothetical protein
MTAENKQDADARTVAALILAELRGTLRDELRELVGAAVRHEFEQARLQSVRHQLKRLSARVVTSEFAKINAAISELAQLIDAAGGRPGAEWQSIREEGEALRRQAESRLARLRAEQQRTNDLDRSGGLGR